MKHPIRWALVAGLLLFATAKFISPYKVTYALPIGVYYASALFETLMAILLIRGGKNARLASVLIMLFFAGGMFLSWVYKGDCG